MNEPLRALEEHIQWFYIFMALHICLRDMLKIGEHQLKSILMPIYVAFLNKIINVKV